MDSLSPISLQTPWCDTYDYETGVRSAAIAACVAFVAIVLFMFKGWKNECAVVTSGIDSSSSSSSSSSSFTTPEKQLNAWHLVLLVVVLGACSLGVLVHALTLVTRPSNEGCVSQDIDPATAQSSFHLLGGAWVLMGVALVVLILSHMFVVYHGCNFTSTKIKTNNILWIGAVLFGAWAAIFGVGMMMMHLSAIEYRSAMPPATEIVI